MKYTYEHKLERENSKILSSYCEILKKNTFKLNVLMKVSTTPIMYYSINTYIATV